jgi:transcriptional regulator with XRE-family HTH domain
MEGYSLEEVSDLTGFSPAMLSRVERGERSFSARAKVRLSRCLGLRVRDLFEIEPASDEEAVS